MRSQPRLIFLSQCLPYPPDSGVANRTFHILTQLQRAFDVELLAFSRRNHQPDAMARDKARRALASQLASVYEPSIIGSEQSELDRVWCHVRSAVARRPYTYYEYASPAFAHALEAALGVGQPDLVHADSLDLFRWLDDVPSVPVAVTHHNLESDLLRRRARQVGFAPLRSYLRLQARLIEEVECSICPRVSLNVTVSDVDGERLRRVAPGSRVMTAPNGVDTNYFTPCATPPIHGRVAFLGPTYMFPNRDGVRFFLAEIWGAVCAAVPDAAFDLIGKTQGADRELFLTSPNVQCHGHVADVRSVLGRAACSIVPLRIGGGTRLKILDSWAMGVAVVSTSVGCEGLDAVDGENILVRDDPGEFARAVIEVLSDDGLRRRLGAAGRATVERLYDWEAIGDRLIAAYLGLL